MFTPYAIVRIQNPTGNAHKIDVIVIESYPSELSLIGLSILFKESQVTRNIPNIIMVNNPEIQKHAKELRFFGIDYLARSCTDDVFLAKMLETTQIYEKAKSEQDRSTAT